MSWFHAEQVAFKHAPEKAKVKLGSMALDIDWKKVEDEYVWGSQVKQDSDGNFERIYPTLNSLAKKYGASFALVGKRAKRGNWLKRRHQCEAKTREEVAKELDDARAKSAAKETCSALAAIDTWIDRFKKGVDDETIKAVSMADLNTAVRLRAFLKGEADSRTAQHVTHSLDELTRRHVALRAKLDRTTDAAAGILDVEEAGPEGGTEGQEGGEEAPAPSSRPVHALPTAPATGAKRRAAGAA